MPVPVGNPIYNLGTTPMNVFIFVGNSSFLPDLSLKLILPPRFLWKVGMPTNPYTIGVAGRCEVRRKRFTAPTLSPA